jgi:hypothetical protein
MFSTNKFVIVCFIVFALWQCYQMYSSIITVFINENSYEFDIKVLTLFNFFGCLISSICLVFGAIFASSDLLFVALCYLFYKLGFILWHVSTVLEITIGCDDRNSSDCDPNRLWQFYKHFLITGELVSKLFLYE